MNPTLQLCLLCFIFSTSSYGQNFTSSPNATIPSFAVTEYPLSVSGLNATMDATFGIEQICININHNYVSDLTLWLISPTGTEILLSNRIGGSGDDYTNTCFTGIITDPFITDGSPPFTGSFQPIEPLGSINNGLEMADGVWVLKISDAVITNTGTLISFTLTFGNNPAIVPTAPNDECTDALLIDVNANYSCNLTTSGTLSMATLSTQTGSCTFLSDFDDDVWFSFTPSTPDQEVVISNLDGSSTDLVYQVLSGDCNSLIEIACHDEPNTGFILNNLNINNSHYLRVASKGTGSQNTTFDICIREAIPAPPANDECASAQVITVPANGCNLTSGTIAGATASPTSDSCPFSGSFEHDIWYAFEATASTLKFSISNIQGSTSTLDYQLLSGHCSNLSQLECSTDPIFVVISLIVGNSYYLRISSFSTSPHNTAFDLCIEIPGGSTNPNDLCANAASIPVNNSPTCNSSINVTLDDARPSSEMINCSNPEFYDDDIWLQFTAQQTSHDFNISNKSNFLADLIFEVYSGAACTNLSSILCHDEPEDIFTLYNLTVGVNYYVRIASKFNALQTVSFDVCITDPSSTCSNVVFNTNASGGGSLRNAIDCSIPGEVITFDPGVYNSTILLESPPIVVPHNITIEASQANQISISNADVNNTSILLDLQAELLLKGVNVTGTGNDALIININGLNASMTALDAELTTVSIVTQ